MQPILCGLWEAAAKFSKTHLKLEDYRKHQTTVLTQIEAYLLCASQDITEEHSQSFMKRWSVYQLIQQMALPIKEPAD